MAPRPRRDPDEPDPGLWDAIALIVFTAALALGLGLLVSCQTYAAVTAAPEEFWVTAESIVWALVEDIWSLVELLL